MNLRGCEAVRGCVLLWVCLSARLSWEVHAGTYMEVSKYCGVRLVIRQAPSYTQERSHARDVRLAMLMSVESSPGSAFRMIGTQSVNKVQKMQETYVLTNLPYPSVLDQYAGPASSLRYPHDSHMKGYAQPMERDILNLTSHPSTVSKQR